MSIGASVMVDVQRDIGGEARHGVESALKAVPGIREAAFSPRVNRLVFVHYDPEVVSSIAINEAVQEFLGADGPATCLVGM